MTPEIPPPTVGTYALHWLAQIRRRVKPRTVETYGLNLAQHWLPALGPDTRLVDLTRGQIRAVLLAKLDDGYATETVRLMLRVLRRMLNWARVEDGVLVANPAEGLVSVLPKRRGPHVQTALDRDELRLFLVAARALHVGLYVLFVVAARTGLRLGELLGLRWEDLDLERRTLYVARTLDWRRNEGSPKGGEMHLLPLSLQASAALRELRARDPGALSPWVFHGPSGRPWSRVHVWRVMDRACKVARLPHASPHALRHSFITHVAEIAETPWEVRDLARHQSITTTEPYLHLKLRYRRTVDALDD